MTTGLSRAVHAALGFHLPVPMGRSLACDLKSSLGQPLRPVHNGAVGCNQFALASTTGPSLSSLSRFIAWTEAQIAIAPRLRERLR